MERKFYTKEISPLRDFAFPKNDKENTAIACVVVTRMVSFLLLGFGFSW